MIAVRKSNHENRVVLHDIKWSTLLAIIDDIGDHRGSRFMYDDGELEIMGTCLLHERTKYMLNSFVWEMAEELDRNFHPAGSTFFGREDLKAFLEADASFYMRDKLKIKSPGIVDTRIDPPPDFVCQIDFSKSAMNILPICARLEIPEVWLFDGEEFMIKNLKSETYIESSTSSYFPDLDIRKSFPEHFEVGLEKGDLTANREFKNWIRRQPRK